MSHNDQLDCVIIGYNEIDPEDLESHFAMTQEFSGGYRVRQFDSMMFRGKKRSYLSVLSELAGRTDDPLSVYNMPSLGGSYLANYLIKRGYRVEVINSFNADLDQFSAVLAKNPRTIAITTTFYVSNDPIQEIVAYAKTHAQHTKIIVGGPRVYNVCSNKDLMAQEFDLAAMGADIYIHDSQGEATLAAVLNEMRKGTSARFSHIPNLIYQDESDRFTRTERKVEANDLDQDAVNWSVFDPEFYVPTTLVRTARSCAFSCSFCNYPVMAGPLNTRSIENVEAELRHLDAMGVKQIAFVDDTFNVPLSRFKELCRMMIANQFDFEWFSYFRASNSDEESVSLMAESGCKGVFLGIESGDQTILNNMKKCATIKKYENGIRWLNDHGVVTFVSLIIGFPGETQETVANTIRFLQRTEPTYYRAELYFHNENAPIHNDRERFGIEGAAYSWTHASMDWREACDAIEMIYENVSDSVILPQGFDFWTIPYLLGQGFNLDDIENFARVAQRLLAFRRIEDPAESTTYEDKLSSLFRCSDSLLDPC